MNRILEMSTKELLRKTIVEQVLDGRIRQKEAAERLKVSERHFRRILRNYRQEGDTGLVSRKRGRSSNRKTKKETLNKVIEFICDPLKKGFGPTFMAEKLEDMEGIKLSKETVRKEMIRCGIWKAKSKKKEKIHPVRPRRVCRGELVQIDGSEHAWLEERGPKATLLVFVDDATSEILAAEFAPEESFFSYGNLCKSYFRRWGLPVGFYSDRFSVFRSPRPKNTGEESVTQFQRALSVLDIEITYAYSPEAKGRVERCNGTLQDRLIKEMRLLGIDNYDAANAYLPEFIADYNRRFAVEPIESFDRHRPLDETEDLDFLFSVHDFRTISKTLQVHYDGKVYQIKSKRPVYIFQNKEVLITQDSDGEITAWLDGNALELEEIEKRPKQSQITASAAPNAKPEPPAYNHPWRTYGKKLNGKPVLTTMITN
jgi:transposase